MTTVTLLLALATTATVAAHGPFTEDFVDFLSKSPELNEYVLSSFREYGDSGTFGGRTDEDEKVTRHPVVFVHGSSDSALHHSDRATGWTKSVEHFKKRGYSGVELFGLTYGTRDINFSLESRITCRDLIGLRRFIEAILDYTETEKVDIIAHSMGVTLARMAAQGGEVHLPTESCNLGAPLAPKIDAFVAISGANYGMCMCLMAGLTHLPACGQSGLAPGKCGRRQATIGDCMDHTECDGEDDYSNILFAVNKADKKEAEFVASLWSNDDNFLGRNNLVWGRKTSLVPGSDVTHGYKKMDHFESKDKTVNDQLSLVSDHRLHGGREKRHQ
ncbi:hypothetical protein PRIPAC_96968 [Pristionchus pacificus]|uniref:Lipase n=1 Tax=Pristionchus pacificus TaxID=54126 RepID=A0A454XS12_PRIPA|nr:hypothetical protein PRIPAC_96968 [Pristionchus pacificus]|eukprot:PDM81857.1 lipase [Pristionchus pacificus]